LLLLLLRPSVFADYSFEHSIHIRGRKTQIQDLRLVIE
jgi:hypothetical protein